jgi:methylmalonyl-CoA/ethylmalonyl-CoA epimerase
MAVVTGLAHVGVIVPDLAAARAYWTGVLGVPTTEPTELAPGLQIAFADLGNTKIELIQPIDPNTAQGKWLAANPKGGLNHLAFDTGSIDASVAEVKTKGVTTDWPAPVPLSNGTKIIFFDQETTGNVLTEFAEAPK